MSSRIYHYKHGFLGLPLILTLLTACSSIPTTYINDNNPPDDRVTKSEINTVHYKLGEGFKTTPPSCIAVMPLKNLIKQVAVSHEKNDVKDGKKVKSESELSEKRLQDLQWNLYSHLAPYPFRDVELGKVNQVVTALGTGPASFSEIGSKLQCDALLLTDLTDYETGHFGLYSQTSIGVQMKLVRATNNEVLWEGNYIAKSHGGGFPLTPIGLVEAVYDATVNLSDAQQVHVEDDLFRHLLSTLDTKSMDTPSISPEQASDNIQVAQEESYPFQIAVPQLYLRSGPGKDYAPKAVLEQHEQLTMLDEQHAPWVQIKMSDGRLGYVNSKYIASK